METITYKGVEVSSGILNYIKHMEIVEEYREDLVSLSKSWDNLSLLSHFTNNTTNIQETKKNFSSLTNTLLDHLSNELLQKTIRQMSFKAQISIDILIRNLFERTADIGFLATDDDIRKFIQENPHRYDENFKFEANKLRERFLEYTQKYSVYYNIVLCDTKGRILVQLDDSSKIDKSEDSIIKQALNQNEYVESFKYHDFIPQRKKSLVYASKVTSSNNNDEPIGVLCLCFRFQDEMKGIFENLKDDTNKECLTILDRDGIVLASSDKYHIGLGSELKFDPSKEYNFITHGGRDYLTKTCKTNGYQGYMGQVWYGHIMVPVEHAFLKECDGLNLDQNILLAILQEGIGFSEELKQIPVEANKIQSNLNRLVWNGNLKKASASHEITKNFSRALLNEISATGEKTKKIFDQSIANLTKTIILNNTAYVASLMSDIMDRNLYERANDCRWWALTQSFKDVLAQNSINKKDDPTLTSILKYINSLYTVYTNLFIFDNDGVIIAVSNDSQKKFIGMQIDDNTLFKTKRIEDSNDYHVSQFHSTKLYDEKSTYIYYASIKEENRFLGGIGIVFDSSVELQAMLEESIPNYSKCEDEKRFGIYTDKNGVVIASTNKDIKIGDTLNIDKKYFNLKNGNSMSEIIVYDGNYYALGVRCSGGYREYKVSDNYTNDVYALFFSYISSADISINSVKEIFTENNSEIKDNTQEIASFYVGGKWLGVEIEKVLEVVTIDKLDLAPTMDNGHYFKGTIIYDEKAVGVIDIKQFLHEDVPNQYKEVVIIKHFDESSENYVGILINELGNIPEIAKSKIKPLEKYLLQDCTLISSVVVPEEEKMKDEKVLSILDIGLLKERLIERFN